MINYQRSLILLTMSLALSTVERNLAQAQPKSSQIPTELDRLEYFEGTWSCRQPAASTKPTGMFTWTVKQDLNQFWYLGSAEQTTSDDSQPINSREFMGYDSASKQLTRLVVVGNGNSYSLTANNWQDGKLVWLGNIVTKGQSTPLREEIIQDSRDKFTATYFVPNQQGKWTRVVDETCDRALMLD